MTSWFKRDQSEFSWDKNFLEGILDITGEPIEAVIIGYSKTIPEAMQNKVLTLAEAEPILKNLPALAQEEFFGI